MSDSESWQPEWSEEVERIGKHIFKLKRLNECEFARLPSGELVRMLKQAVVKPLDKDFFAVERIEAGPGVLYIEDAMNLTPVNPLELLAEQAGDSPAPGDPLFD